MQYPTLAICREILFPYIRDRMATAEPAPSYEHERGLAKLESAFHFMQRDEYEGLLGKASYLFCSIIDGHHFSNGNKRLAVVVLVYFLLINNCKIHAPNMAVLRAELVRIFPNVKWEKIKAFRHAHEYFFYHLAIIIADRQQKGNMTFTEERVAVEQMLRVIVLRS